MNKICIKDVLHIPKLEIKLLSVSKLLSNKLKVQFHGIECIVGDVNNDVIPII